MRPERVWRWLVFAVVFASGIFGAIPAAEATDYEALMREGVALRRTGDDLAALKRFQQAYEINKTPKAVAQIGLAEQALGRWAPAEKHLRQALESADDAWIKKNRASIDQAIVVIASHVGQLEVSGTPAAAEVRVDGELVGQLPLPRPITVTAGGVAVEVRAPGYLPIVRAATIIARTLTRETFTLQSLSPVADQGAGAAPVSPPRTTARPADSAPASSGTAGSPAEGAAAGGGGEASPPEPPVASSAGAAESTAQPAEGGSGRRALVFVAAGLSMASLAFGLIEHLAWQQKVDSFSSMSACGASFPDRGGPGCKQLFDGGARARLLAFTGYGLTAAFAVTAVVLFVTEPDGGSEPRKVACAPIVMTPGFGCALRF